MGSCWDPPRPRETAKEAVALARLRHPGIVQVFEVGEHQGGPYCSLEYCPHGGLEDYLATTPVEPAAATRLVRGLASAMQAAHEAKGILRDLKPANVLLAPRGGSPCPRGSVRRCRRWWGR